MLDQDLAELYQVETKALVQAVQRNAKRFPPDFMFQLSFQEFAALRSQIVTSKGRGGRRTAPYAFTEHGVAMLSSVLRSECAVEINIEVIRAFVNQILRPDTTVATPVDAEANALSSPLLLPKKRRVTIEESSVKVDGPRASRESTR